MRAPAEPPGPVTFLAGEKGRRYDAARNGQRVTMQTGAASVGRNAPCPCGSGRKYKHCCGRAAGAPPRRAADPISSGLAAFQSGRFEDAAALFRQALRSAPKSLHAAYFLGLAYAELSRFEDADAQISSALEMGLNDPAAHYHHARALVGLDRADEAESALRRAVALKPDFPQALALLANLHFVRRAFEPAEELYRKALAFDPANRLARRNLAECAFALDRLDEALAILDALARGDGAEAHQDRLAALRFCERGNRLAEAERRAAGLLAAAPNDRGVLALAAKVARRLERPDDAADLLARAGEPPLHDDAEGAALAHERAQLLERAGRMAEAFAAYAEAKRRQGAAQKARYDHAAFAARLDAAEQAVGSAGWPRAATATEAAAASPVFVMGFLRSGTTLLEQMLSAHSRIGAAGELTILQELNDRATPAGRAFPEGWAELDPEAREALAAPMRAAYLDRLRKRGGDKPRAVDKHPFNILRLPLASALFPGAPAIRMVRHPLDVILSCFFNLFDGGNEWSFSLLDAARHLARTHRHFHAVAPRLDLRLREMRYERLVAEPEAELRAVLAWLGEEWDPACLAFHRSTRVVATASYAQVSRPLYGDAVDRWRRYAELLPGEAVEALRPMADELEYGMP